MKKHYVLWEDGMDKNYLIDAEEVKSSCSTGDNTILIYNINPLIDEELNEKLTNYIEQKEKEDEDFSFDNTPEDIQEFLIEIGHTSAEVDWSEFYEERKDILAFDTIYKTFSNLADWDEYKTYEYWDGNNWVTAICDDITTETELIVTEDYVDLDEWDGNNMCTGDRFEHEYVHKVIELDGKSVENTYLIRKTSNWEGVQPKGYIMTKEDLQEHLEELKRDVSEYMYEIGKLEGK